MIRGERGGILISWRTGFAMTDTLILYQGLYVGYETTDGKGTIRV